MRNNQGFNHGWTRMNTDSGRFPMPQSAGRLLRTPQFALRIRNAFTLIEMLVVVGIIAILAALIIPATNSAKAARMRSRAKSELNAVDTMIANYKTTLNYYPPSASNSVSWTFPFASLYYELLGTKLVNGTNTTLDGSANILASNIPLIFGVGGFNNVSQGGGDEGVIARNFAKGGYRPGTFLELETNNIKFMVLGTSVDFTNMWTGTSGAKINPFGYNSASPTNNPRSYDLWVDLQIRDKTERIFSTPQ